MFTPGNKAKVGAQNVFGGNNSSCDSCGAGRSDMVSSLGLDGVPQVPPLGIQTGTGSDFPAQSAAALGQAVTATQGFNLLTGGTSVDWVMTFTPSCPVRLLGLFIDPSIASDLEVQAIYCGWTGYSQDLNLLPGRPGSALANSNFTPAIMFSQLNQTVPGFQSIDAVFTNTAVVIVTGRTKQVCAASIALSGAIITKAA